MRIWFEKWGQAYYNRYGTPFGEVRTNNMKKIWTLFLTFLKIGAFTFGGGYAMIALLEDEFLAKKKWLDKEEFLNMVAIAESTPGPVAVNSATYLGYRLAGVPGAFAATAAVCLPSFFVIYLISLFFDQFLSLTYVDYAFRGIRVCVVYLIFSAGIKMLRTLDHSLFQVIVLVGVMGVMILSSLFSTGFSSIVLILICGAMGVTLYLIGLLAHKPGREENKK